MTFLVSSDRRAGVELEVDMCMSFVKHGPQQQTLKEGYRQWT